MTEDGKLHDEAEEIRNETAEDSPELQEHDRYLRVRRSEQPPAVVDAPAGAAEPLHAHPTDEVVVVTAGSATYFLGEHQARIVRAGEIVRIPAGVPHHWEAGSDGFGAVAVQAADRL